VVSDRNALRHGNDAELGLADLEGFKMNIERKIVPFCREKCIFIGRGKKNVLLRRSIINAYRMLGWLEDSRHHGESQYPESADESRSKRGRYNDYRQYGNLQIFSYRREQPNRLEKFGGHYGP